MVFSAVLNPSGDLNNRQALLLNIGNLFINRRTNIFYVRLCLCGQ
tara:strand:- start:528 stop:662 length:135 start_codon:yes stop_codon:yes gene_type:complete